MSDIEQDRLTWIKERPRHEAFGFLIQARTESILRPLGIWFEVTSRAKAIDSLVKKLLRDRTDTLESLPDKVGARIVTKYRSDIDRTVEKLAGILIRRYAMTRRKILGPTKSAPKHSSQCRSLRGDDPAALEYPPASFWAEVQVRTLAQHLWSEMTHDSFYKNDAMLLEFLMMFEGA